MECKKNNNEVEGFLIMLKVVLVNANYLTGILSFKLKYPGFFTTFQMALRKNSTLQKPCESPVTSCFQPCLRYFRAVNWL